MEQLIVAEKSIQKKGNICRVVGRKKTKNKSCIPYGYRTTCFVKIHFFFLVTNTYNPVSSPSMIHHHKALKNKNYPFGRSSAW